MKALRRLVQVLALLVSPFVIYFGMAAVGALLPHPDTATVGGGADQHEIILVAGVIHYDILLPVDDATREAFDFVEAGGVPLSHPLVRWLSVGWGSEAFYTSTGTYADLEAGTVWQAATGDAGVLRFEVTGPLPVHRGLRRIKVTTAQLNALRTSIRADLEGAVALPLDGFTPTDAFYSARGRFHLLRTCNTWVADKLAAAGLPIGAWTPTPNAVTLSLWWNGHLGTAPTPQ